MNLLPKKYVNITKSTVLKEFIAKLPSDRSVEFSEHIIALVENNESRIISHCNNLLKSIPINETKTRFGLFYIQVTFYRKFNAIHKIEDLVKIHKKEFEHHPLFVVALSLSHLNKKNFNNAIECAEKACKELPQHRGVVHHYTFIVASCIDWGHAPEKSVVDRAMKYADDVLLLNKSNPRYYISKGIIQGYTEDFQNALDNIEQGLKIADVGRKDYFLLVHECYRHLARIRTQSAMRSLDKSISDVNDNLLKAGTTIEQLAKIDLSDYVSYKGLITGLGSVFSFFQFSPNGLS